MTLDEYEKLPPEEQDFYRCSKCGQFVDKRELRDVIFHETDHKPNPRIPQNYRKTDFQSALTEGIRQRGNSTSGADRAIE